VDTPEDGADSAGSDPAESQPDNSQPESSQPGETQPGETQPGETQPDETQAVEAPTVEAGTAETAPAAKRAAGARAASAWQAFRAWRRSRPFWGGLLLLLAGIELVAIPLLSVLAHGSVKVVIYIGIGGVSGVLIGGLLMACGLLVWFHPVQRVFYAIAGVLLAVASFVATNLGGFFFGMLLGVTGASLSFGWTHGPDRLAGQHRPRPRPAGPPSEGLGLVLGTEPGGERAADRAGRVSREGAGASGADHEARWTP
jgi:hypothetical protein